MAWSANEIGERTTLIAGCLITLLIGLVCLRSWVFVWFPQVHLDADQAVFGLMGKDIAFGRAYPLFMYGQRYMLAVGSWLCAPPIAAFGLSVTTLKLPMLAMNIGCVALLWIGLRRCARRKSLDVGTEVLVVDARECSTALTLPAAVTVFRFITSGCVGRTLIAMAPRDARRGEQ